MNKPTILLFSLAIGLLSPAASQAPVEKIAYDTCSYVHWANIFSCTISVANVDGTGTVTLPAGSHSSPPGRPTEAASRLTTIYHHGVSVWNPEDGINHPLRLLRRGFADLGA